ncbi:unnamed protein product, partial [Choristocarpus tenellus]
ESPTFPGGGGLRQMGRSSQSVSSSFGWGSPREDMSSVGGWEETDAFESSSSNLVNQSLFLKVQLEVSNPSLMLPLDMERGSSTSCVHILSEFEHLVAIATFNMLSNSSNSASAGRNTQGLTLTPAFEESPVFGGGDPQEEALAAVEEAMLATLKVEVAVASTRVWVKPEDFEVMEAVHMRAVALVPLDTPSATSGLFLPGLTVCLDDGERGTSMSVMGGESGSGGSCSNINGRAVGTGFDVRQDLPAPHGEPGILTSLCEDEAAAKLHDKLGGGGVTEVELPVRPTLPNNRMGMIWGEDSGCVEVVDFGTSVAGKSGGGANVDLPRVKIPLSLAAQVKAAVTVSPVKFNLAEPHLLLLAQMVQVGGGKLSRIGELLAPDASALPTEKDSRPSAPLPTRMVVDHVIPPWSEDRAVEGTEVAALASGLMAEGTESGETTVATEEGSGDHGRLHGGPVEAVGMETKTTPDVMPTGSLSGLQIQREDKEEEEPLWGGHTQLEAVVLLPGEEEELNMLQPSRLVATDSTTAGPVVDPATSTITSSTAGGGVDHNQVRMATEGAPPFPALLGTLILDALSFTLSTETTKASKGGARASSFMSATSTTASGPAMMAPKHRKGLDRDLRIRAQYAGAREGAVMATLNLRRQSLSAPSSPTYEARDFASSSPGYVGEGQKRQTIGPYAPLLTLEVLGIGLGVDLTPPPRRRGWSGVVSTSGSDVKGGDQGGLGSGKRRWAVQKHRTEFVIGEVHILDVREHSVVRDRHFHYLLRSGAAQSKGTGSHPGTSDNRVDGHVLPSGWCWKGCGGSGEGKPDPGREGTVVADDDVVDGEGSAVVEPALSIRAQLCPLSRISDIRLCVCEVRIAVLPGPLLELAQIGSRVQSHLTKLCLVDSMWSASGEESD